MDWFFSDKINTLLSNGYSLKEISKKLNIKYNTLTIYYKPEIKTIKFFSHFGSKKESYYSNEWDYGFTPTYSWESLSKSEKNFYIHNKIFTKKNND